jgi:WS/DGAT/MGAT family acyltransferase
VRARGPGQGVRGFEPQAAPATRPGAAELAAAALRHDVGQYVKFVRHLPEVLRTLGGMLGGGGESRGRDRARARDTRSAARAFGPRTALNVPISGERGFAALSLPLDSLKRLARAHDAKLNDVVLALASGALRRWLARHGGIPREALIAAMPISLRAPGNTEYTTQATMSLVNLHTHIADPVRRLRAIRDSATAVKSVAGRVKGIVPTDFPSIAVPWILHALASLYGRTRLAAAIPPIANVVISNVPGPQVPLYAAGARMRTYWPMSIVEHGLGLNLTVMSYAGAMGFGFTTAREAVPDARELSKALEEAFAELVARSKPRAGGRAITAPVRNANAARRESRGSIRKSAASARKSGLSARKSAALVRKSAASSRESATRTRKATTPR